MDLRNDEWESAFILFVMPGFSLTLPYTHECTRTHTHTHMHAHTGTWAHIFFLGIIIVFWQSQNNPTGRRTTVRPWVAGQSLCKPASERGTLQRFWKQASSSGSRDHHSLSLHWAEWDFSDEILPLSLVSCYDGPKLTEIVQGSSLLFLMICLPISFFILMWPERCMEERCCSASIVPHECLFSPQLI